MLWLLQSGRPYDTDQLADVLHVSKRTIQRDLARLTGAGLPLVFEEQQRSYRIDRAFALPPPRLSREELIALTVCVEDYSERAEPEPRRAVQQAIARLLAGSPTTERLEVWTAVSEHRSARKGGRSAVEGAESGPTPRRTLHEQHPAGAGPHDVAEGQAARPPLAPRGAKLRSTDQ
jgi:predicted DNA-binding transcriptional regulator YafY